MKNKFIVNYTQKIEFTNGKFNGTHSKDFPSREDALDFVSSEPSIYWSEIVEAEPKSKLSALCVQVDDPGLTDYTRHEGILETYYETGMESISLILYRDGFDDSPNPKFNPSEPESKANFRYFKSLEAALFIKNGDILEIDGKLIYLFKDREFARADGFKLSFYPRGFTKAQWVELFASEERRAALWVKSGTRTT
jgi:hypothetical protein